MARPAKSTFTREYEALRAELVRLRQEAGLTQRQLAVRMGRVHSYVARAEIGDRRMDVLEFVWWCRACGQDPRQVLARWLGKTTAHAGRAPRRARPARQ